MWRDYKPNTMNKQFILLTTTENTEIIICLSNIATIQAAERNQNMTEIKFNYAKDNELSLIHISEPRDGLLSIRRQRQMCIRDRNTEIIICLSNIATIQAAERNQNMTEIKFNYAKDNE